MPDSPECALGQGGRQQEPSGGQPEKSWGENEITILLSVYVCSLSCNRESRERERERARVFTNFAEREEEATGVLLFSPVAAMVRVQQIEEVLCQTAKKEDP